MTYYGAKELAESFRTVRKNTLQIAQDIPEDKYGFKAADGTRTVEKLRSRLGKIEAQVPQATDLSARISGLNLRIGELESSGAPRAEALTGKPGALSGTVRSKVLKMHRLGQPADRIADNLRVPKGEVDLLVKVHQIVMRPYEQSPVGTGEAEMKAATRDDHRCE